MSAALTASDDEAAQRGEETLSLLKALAIADRAEIVYHLKGAPEWKAGVVAQFAADNRADLEDKEAEISVKSDNVRKLCAEIAEIRARMRKMETVSSGTVHLQEALTLAKQESAALAYDLHTLKQLFDQVNADLDRALELPPRSFPPARGPMYAPLPRAPPPTGYPLSGYAYPQQPYFDSQPSYGPI